MNQNLSSYWIFYTVANAGNISKAAKELYISQPAISKSIQKLEESLGCKLFSRSSRGVILTDEGSLLFEHVKAAFETLSIGEENLKNSLDMGVGHLNIGVSSALCKHLLLPYLKEFIRQNPHIGISINCHSSYETLKLLEDNKIDVCLICKPTLVRSIDFTTLEHIEDCFVCNADYLKHLSSRNIPVEEYLNHSILMVLDQNNTTRRYVDRYLLENSISPKEIIETSDMSLLIEFAKIGLGIACVIKKYVENELADGTLIEIKPPFLLPKRDIGYCVKKNGNASKALNTFIKFLNTYEPTA